MIKFTGGGSLEVGEVRYRVEPFPPDDLGDDGDPLVKPGPGGDILRFRG